MLLARLGIVAARGLVTPTLSKLQISVQQLLLLGSRVSVGYPSSLQEALQESWMLEEAGWGLLRAQNDGSGTAEHTWASQLCGEP